MLTLKQIVNLLQDRNLTEVSRRTGLHRQTLWLIMTGKTPSPGYKTLQILSDYFKGQFDVDA
jgi:transcriptional regulator with XRE-family HTH domain